MLIEKLNLFYFNILLSKKILSTVTVIIISITIELKTVETCFVIFKINYFFIFLILKTNFKK